MQLAKVPLSVQAPLAGVLRHNSLRQVVNVARPVQCASQRSLESATTSTGPSPRSFLATSLPAAAALLLTPLASLAEEAAAEAPAAVEAVVTESKEEPTILSYIVVLAPLILYGIFNVYRSQVNPRAKISDFIFLVAGAAVISNLVSILAFRVRLF